MASARSPPLSSSSIKTHLQSFHARPTRPISVAPIVSRATHLREPISSKGLTSSRFKSDGRRRVSRPILSSLVGTLEENVDRDSTGTIGPEIEVRTSMWNWRGYNIRYQYAGSQGPSLLLIHGFGANSDHWRKNIPILAKSHKVYSIDLIGYGYSDKPNPRDFGSEPFYTFETWATQINEFCTSVVKDGVFFICNSIGGMHHEWN